MNAPDSPTFTIGTVPVYGRTILAPMDGYSDLPFRGLARQLGSALSYTEFINAIEVLNNHHKMPQRLTFEPSERPIVYQLFDNDPDRLLKAARRLMEHKPDILDINMGCSARSVSGRGAGAGLLREPKKIAKIIASLSAELPIPVTAKIRLGWDEDTLNYLEIAKIVAENGGKMIAVHARTRQQGYGGQAIWSAIAEIKQAVSIPVIGNGDVKTTHDVNQMIAQTGCDAVMIGRAAIGNPWIFSGIDREDVSPVQVRQTILTHLKRMIGFYGAERGLVLFRKHVQRYISPYGLNQAERRKLLTCTEPEEFISFLDQLPTQLVSSKEDEHVPEA